jgi:hypothetical protein
VPGRPQRVAATALAAIALLGASALAETVAIVTASSASDGAATALGDQLDLPSVRRESDNARHLEALVTEARAGWREELVVVVDTDRAVVSVLRPSDGTMSSRSLDARAAKAPYAVALAAVELLEIVRNAPPARAAALPIPSPPSPVRLSLDTGLVQTISTNGDVALLQPTVGADVEFLTGSGTSWLSLGLHGVGLAPMHRSQVLLLPSGQQEHTRLEYARDELALRLGIGTREGHAAVAGWTDVGLGFVDVTVTGTDVRQVARDHRTAFWLGLGGELRYSLGAGLAIGVGAGGAWYPVTSRFYASPASAPSPLVALQEGGIELRARAALLWEIP